MEGLLLQTFKKNRNGFHLDDIGAFLNLPQAIKAAIIAKTIFTPIKEASPLEIWKILAHIISAMIPSAAMGVRLGLTRVSAGSINPIAPKKSTTPVNFTNATGTWPVQGHIADNFSIG
jgi:hypothetical protein